MKKIMTFNCKILTIAFFVGVSNFLCAQNIPNPVLENVADAGVIKHNGKYYIGGVFTDGSFYVSADLVNWEGPVHVFTMDNDWTRGSGAGNDQIHANDMVYINGLFHLYWSVNYWGNDKHAVHIGHATSNNVTGPYIEPMKDTWVESRIDPKVFRDDDGKLYMYYVKFTDGNTIWVRPTNNNGATFNAPPIYQFASLPATWETMDNRVAEGPWVLKYRNRYYMMYNANHTSTEWGNYQLGVAEADFPVNFNHGNKYPYPLLLSNQTGVDEQYANLLNFNNSEYKPSFLYRTEAPKDGWRKSAINNEEWKTGKGGFTSQEIEGSTVRTQGTVWDTDNLYLLKTFTANKAQTGNLALRVVHGGNTKVYLNNVLIYDKQGRDYTIVNIDDKIKSNLRNGENVLAVETQKGNKDNYFDVSFFDMKADKADDILFSPGQPNILRGLNGFEWWLIYMANKNDEKRSQYINRIHFFDKTMYADGLTSNNTKGYFPVPTKPSYGDAFDNENLWKSEWNPQGTWSVNNGELSTSGTASHSVLNNKYVASSYLFEAGVNTATNAGVYAWWLNNENWIKVGIDKSSNKWYFETCLKGTTQKETYSLPSDFKFGVYHTIAVERNVNSFFIRIDDLPANEKSRFTTSISGNNGVPGLFAENGAAFDGIVYTIGWDEFDNNIAAWEKTTGEYTVSEKGLQAKSGKFEAFKGDLLPQYEYSAQITSLDNKGISGIYPVYIDKDNYVQAAFNYNTHKLDVRAVLKGKTVFNESIALNNLQTHYADMKYTDFIEKGYTFNTPTLINEIYLNRIASHNGEFINNMFDKLAVEYKKNNKWFAINGNAVVDSNPLYNKLSFNKVEAEELRFTNKNASDIDSYIYKIRVNELFKQSYNLRAVKLNDKIMLFVDGKMVCTIDKKFGASKVGIFTDGCEPVYNGILRYHVPE